MSNKYVSLYFDKFGFRGIQLLTDQSDVLSGFFQVLPQKCSIVGRLGVFASILE